ncbi:hypothetical protein ACJ72_02137 [Emergomyces africanus]|uniref:Uncharacterized protein n=1 Tax=Emergomyces africanus TaxID=1955775 RepID=A0A1B7P379_9EURO|nr:hypothetical protein ACJ72_02137 [Emergomyces africanus]
MDTSSPTSRAEQTLSPPNILDRAATCLGNDNEAPPKNPWEAIALIAHACMIAVDFRLIGLEEDQRIEPQAPLSPLPKEWNANSTYAFKYAHPQSSMQFLLKVTRLGGNAVIYALALGHDKTTSFDIPVKDYVSESSLPLSKHPEGQHQQASSLEHVFISPSRLNDLINLFKINVIQKLTPGLQKESYEDDSSSRRERQRVEEEEEQGLGQPVRQPRQPIRDPLRDDRYPEPARPYPFDDPLAAPPRRPVPTGDFPPPGFEDEYEINVPPRGFRPGIGHQPRRPDLGERDLYPAGLGPHDPLVGHFGPQRGGGGMHPTFDDPMFQPRGGGGGGGGGGGEFNPQIPPGARYDPIGPGDGPPMGRGQGGPGFPGGRGGFGGGFGGGAFGGGFGGGDII